MRVNRELLKKVVEKLIEGWGKFKRKEEKNWREKKRKFEEKRREK